MNKHSNVYWKNKDKWIKTTRCHKKTKKQKKILGNGYPIYRVSIHLNFPSAWLKLLLDTFNFFVWQRKNCFFIEFISFDLNINLRHGGGVAWSSGQQRRLPLQGLKVRNSAITTSFFGNVPRANSSEEMRVRNRRFISREEKREGRRERQWALFVFSFFVEGVTSFAVILKKLTSLIP